MKWFKHMSNMRHDPKVKRLKKSYGADGYAVYVEIISAIADNLDPINNILPFLEEDISEIGEEFNIPEHKTIEIVNFCIDQGLLEKSENNYIFCFKLYKFVDEYFTKKQANTQDVADRNKAVISAYKDGGLPAALTILQEFIPNLMQTIGVIEINNGNKRSNLALLRPNSGVTTDIIRPDKSILDYKREDNIKREEEDKKNISPPPPSFSSYAPKPSASDFDTFEPNTDRQRFLEIKKHWKQCENLPQSKLLDTNMNIGHEALDMLKVFPNEDICKAIDNYNLCFSKIEPKYRIKSFSNFMTSERIEVWISDAAVEEYYPKEKSESQKEIDKIEEFLIIVKDTYNSEQKAPYLEKIKKLREKEGIK